MGSRQRSTTKKGKSGKAVRALRVLRENVAGIDLGSREHWVCCPGEAGQKPNVRTFGSTTPELQKLADWLESEAIESVAMEATGIYWIPLYELLEARGIEVVLVNARQLSHVPGRKTDMLDCQWLQLRHSCGLLRGSFRPIESICQWRTLQTRTGQHGARSDPSRARDAKGPGPDERSSPSSSERPDREDRPGHGRSHCPGGTRPLSTGRFSGASSGNCC